MLPFQIYTGKIERCLTKNATGKKNVLFSYKALENHWSNEVETLSLIDRIILWYIGNLKKELLVANDKKSPLIWDAFKGQGTSRVQVRIVELGVVVAMVPKNMTPLLQPLDITTNNIIKIVKKDSVTISHHNDQQNAKC